MKPSTLHSLGLIALCSLLSASCCEPEGASVTIPSSSSKTSPFCPAKASPEAAIPKIMHHIWHDWSNGKNPSPPAHYQRWENELKELHPESAGWTHMFWDNEKSLNFIKKVYPEYAELYLGYDKPIKRADALRYLLLDHFGGLYLDMGFVPLKALDPLLENCEVVLFEQSSLPEDMKGRISNGAMASIPGHPLWKKIIQSLPERKNEFVLYATGPQLVTEKSIDHLRQLPDSIWVYDKDKLFPFDWRHRGCKEAQLCFSDTNACRDRFPDSYLVNLWAASWAE